MGRGMDTVKGMEFFLDIGAKLEKEDKNPKLTKYKEQARELWLEEARLKEEEKKKKKAQLKKKTEAQPDFESEENLEAHGIPASAIQDEEDIEEGN